MLDSCEALEYEVLSAVPLRIPRGPTLRWVVERLVTRRLRLRNRVHARVRDPILEGTARMVGVGGSIVTVYLSSDGKYRILVPKRSDDVVAGQKGLYAVVPTFIVEAAHAITGDHSCYSIEENVIQECDEELLDHRRPTGASSSGGREHVLRGMLRNGKAYLVPLGIAVNLLNLRPDVCCLLVIDDQNFIESVSLSPEFSREGRDRSHLPVKSHLDALAEEKLLFEPHEIAPACAGALWLALNRIREAGGVEKVITQSRVKGDGVSETGVVQITSHVGTE
jgi:hypothetical protein